MLRKIYVNTLSFLLRSLISLVGMTLKMDIQGLEKIEGNSIFAVWHRDTFIFSFQNPLKKLAILAADGPKGDIFSNIVKPRPEKIIRVPFNSDNPRAAAFAASKLLKALEEGFNSAIALDGPRGPIYKIKPGIFLIANKSGEKIIPVGVAASRKITVPFRWDNYYIPLPFSKVSLYMDSDYSGDLDETSLSKGMLAAHEKAKKLLDRAC